MPLTETLALQWLPCQTPGVIGSAFPVATVPDAWRYRVSVSSGYRARRLALWGQPLQRLPCQASDVMGSVLGLVRCVSIL